MNENDLTEKIIGCAIEVHRNLGPGLLESVYEEALCYELSKAGLSFVRQQSVPIQYKQVKLATPLKLDLIVEDKVIVDNKAKPEITDGLVPCAHGGSPISAGAHCQHPRPPVPR